MTEMMLVCSRRRGGPGLAAYRPTVLYLRDTRAREAGFTLMEAMVVVAVIAISAAIAAPAMSRAMADRRAGEGNHSIVRIVARAQSESIAYGRAHLLRYSDASDGGSNGRLELWRGNLDRCSAVDWATTVSGACASTQSCVDLVDMDVYEFAHHSVEMRMPGATGGDLCFEPDGDTFYRNGTTGVFGLTPPAGIDGIRFTITRLEGGTAAGVQRAVVVPFGGPARVVR